MRTFRILARTNQYLANRDARFNGKTEIIIESGLSLKQANEALLDLYNQVSDKYASNWGIAVIQTRNNVDQAYKTHEDGTRRFDYDSRTFETEIEENNL